MSNRVRVISQANAIFVTSGVATGQHFTGNDPVTGTNLVKQLYRVTNNTMGYTIPRQPVEEFGVLAYIDRITVEPPTAPFTVSWNSANVLNEKNLGFVVDGSTTLISGIINNTQDPKNYFVLEVDEGHDANGYSHQTNQDKVVTYAIGNGYISKYSYKAQVGAIPSCEISVEGQNMEVYQGSTGLPIPAVDPATSLPITGVLFSIPSGTSGPSGMASALRPGDVTFTLTNNRTSGQAVLGVDIANGHVQSFTLDIDLAREAIRQLGAKFPFARPIRFPVNATLSTEILVGPTSSGSVANILCNDDDYTANIAIRLPDCSNAGAVAVAFTVKGLKIDSANWNQAVGQEAKRVTLNFSAPIAGPEDNTRGVLLSGITS